MERHEKSNPDHGMDRAPNDDYTPPLPDPHERDSNEGYESELSRQEQPRRLAQMSWLLTVVFFGMILPILAMAQCSGFNEGSMEVRSCHVIDTPWARSYASLCYGWLLVCAFSGGILLVLYLLFLWAIFKWVGRCVASLPCLTMPWWSTTTNREREIRLLDPEETAELV
jgi:hypothetical protein